MVEIYAYDYYIDGELYGGTISAKSHEHVLELVPFAQNIGRLECEYPTEWEIIAHYDEMDWEGLPIL